MAEKTLGEVGDTELFPAAEILTGPPESPSFDFCSLPQAGRPAQDCLTLFLLFVSLFLQLI